MSSSLASTRRCAKRCGRPPSIWARYAASPTTPSEGPDTTYSSKLSRAQPLPLQDRSIHDLGTIVIEHGVTASLAAKNTFYFLVSALQSYPPTTSPSPLPHEPHPTPPLAWRTRVRYSRLCEYGLPRSRRRTMNFLSLLGVLQFICSCRLPAFMANALALVFAPIRHERKVAGVSG